MAFNLRTEENEKFTIVCSRSPQNLELIYLYPFHFYQAPGTPSLSILAFEKGFHGRTLGMLISKLIGNTLDSINQPKSLL